MLGQRIITAVALLAVLLPTLFHPNPAYFNFVVLVLMGAAGWEWGRLNGMARPGACLLGLACVLTCGLAWRLGMLRISPAAAQVWLAVGLGWVAAGVWLLRGGPQRWSAVPQPIRLVTGFVALVAAWLAVAQAKVIGVNFLLSIFLLVWIADIFAYFAGRAWGGKFTRTKLAPSISPGKSWEGVWGGMAGVLVLSLAWCWLDEHYAVAVPSLYSLSLGKGWWVLAVTVIGLTAASVIGDLVESLVKRSAGVKDSSGLLPGHGGVFGPGRCPFARFPHGAVVSLAMTPVTFAKPKGVAILGSTGSIGANTLDVISRHAGRFNVVALTASTQVDLMLRQCVRHRPRVAVMADAASGRNLKEKCGALGLSVEVRWGAQAIAAVAIEEDVEIVMAAIVGAAGLASCMAAAHAGKRLLLANKEALVVGGEVFMAAVRRGSATLLPIDSEHSAIFQSLPDDPSTWSRRIGKIMLTASGGPFRQMASEKLRDVSPDQACAHPNWVMGRKISVDSATMMNKALEVIEARYLFNVEPRQLEVVIHPQSVIHSMVQYTDNSVVAQLGTPDMRGPIAYGLSWPERMENGTEPLNFATLGALTFETMDMKGHAQRFPGLALAWTVLEEGAGRPAVLNAANEVAVAAFLDGRIRFDQIHAVNMATLSGLSLPEPRDLDALLALDQESRSFSLRAVQAMAV